MNNIDIQINPIDPANVTQLELPDGTLMPQAAMGTFHSDNPDLINIMEDVILESIRLGYRHIDCAMLTKMKKSLDEQLQKQLILVWQKEKNCSFYLNFGTST